MTNPKTNFGVNFKWTESADSFIGLRIFLAGGFFWIWNTLKINYVLLIAICYNVYFFV